MVPKVNNRNIVFINIQKATHNFDPFDELGFAATEFWCHFDIGERGIQQTKLENWFLKVSAGVGLGN